MSQPVKLYNFYVSPPARAVTMVLKLLDIPHEIVPTHLGKSQQYSPEFLKMNPNHEVPVLDDNGFYLSESRAIISYLLAKFRDSDVAKSGKHADLLEQLYPKNDLQKRAKIDEQVQQTFGFHHTLLYAICMPILPTLKPWSDMVAGNPGLVAMLENLKPTFAKEEGVLRGKLDKHNQSYGARNFELEAFNLADLILMEEIMMAVLLHRELNWEMYPNLKKAYDEYAKLPYFDHVHVDTLKFYETGVDQFEHSVSREKTNQVSL